jgi:hypothetical protein
MPTKPRTRGRRANGRPPKHGARALARHLAANAIDNRTWVARHLKTLRDEWAEDAGGHQYMNNRQRVLLKHGTQLDVIADSAFSFLAVHLAGLAKGEMPPPEVMNTLTRVYLAHVAQLTRCLDALGLRPERADRVPVLEDYLAARDADAGNGRQDAPASLESDAADPADTSTSPAAPTPHSNGG